MKRLQPVRSHQSRERQEMAPRKPAEDGWTVVEEPTAKVSLDTKGDVLIGVYEGFEMVTMTEDGEEKKFRQDLFRGHELSNPGSSAEITPGVRYGLASGYQLREQLDKAEKGLLTRVTYVDDLPMSGSGRNPMKLTMVEQRKA